MGAAALSLVAAGCWTRPAVMEGGDAEIVLRDFPPATEQVEVSVALDGFLRGVFVSAEPGAPVVLHVLESGCSVTQGAREFPALAVVVELSDRGLASLVLDYRGVGPSDGEPSPDNLRGDAQAAWREAVRRAGGDSSRVVLRGMAIGSLAATGLIEDGERPGAVVLIAPVRAETVSQHFAQHSLMKPLGYLVSPYLRDTSDVDLVATLYRARVPLMVASPGKEHLLSEDERHLARLATRSALGRWHRFDDLDHIDMVLEGHRMLECEEGLYWELFPELPPIAARTDDVLASIPADARARFQVDHAAGERLESLAQRWKLDPPPLAAALALAGFEARSREAPWIVERVRGFAPESREARPFEALLSWLDIDDPLGRRDVTDLRAMALLASRTPGFDGGEITPEALVRRAVTMRLERRAIYDPSLLERRPLASLYEGERLADMDQEPVPDDAPARLRLPQRESMRQAVRLLFKAACVSERVVCESDGRLGLEVWQSDGWRRLELPSLEGDVPAGQTG